MDPTALSSSRIFSVAPSSTSATSNADISVAGGLQADTARLLLLHLRWLDFVVDGEALTTKLLICLQVPQTTHRHTQAHKEK